MSERFAFVDVGNMHLNDGRFHPRNCVANRYRRMCKTTRVEDDAKVIGIETDFVNFINQHPFVVALKTLQLDRRKRRDQDFEVIFKSLTAVNMRLAPAQKIEVWAV